MTKRILLAVAMVVVVAAIFFGGMAALLTCQYDPVGCYLSFRF